MQSKPLQLLARSVTQRGPVYCLQCNLLRLFHIKRLLSYSLFHKLWRAYVINSSAGKLRQQKGMENGGFFYCVESVCKICPPRVLKSEINLPKRLYFRNIVACEQQTYFRSYVANRLIRMISSVLFFFIFVFQSLVFFLVGLISKPATEGVLQFFFIFLWKELLMSNHSL